jgi:S1-C subfamily serine protease
MRLLALLFSIVTVLTLPRTASSAPAEDAIRNSVVQVFVTQRAPNFTQPWTKSPPREGSGTGFVIDGKRIMTNAHVVRYGSQIYVQGYQSPEKVPANVVGVAPGIDLAVLSVEENGFFDSRPPIPLGEGLPKVKGTVNVYGFPLGGEQMSVTEGIISRVEAASYVYRTPGVRVQIDAALNPGNSGGPAVSDGKLAGVAFSGVPTAENIGYLIPVEEITTFLADIADGTYDGKPQLLEEFQTVENDALRARLGLPKGVGGAMVTRPAQTDDAYPLKEWDVITRVGDHVIDSAAKVQVAPDLQLPFTYYVPKLAHDGKAPLTVLRGGKEMTIEAPVPVEEPSKVPYLKGDYPSYFIYGPLVFTPVCKEMIAAYGQLLLRDRGLALLKHMNEPPAFEGEQLVVVASPMFSHRITKSYGQPMLNVVSTVNGTSVRNLAHLAELLRDAKDEFIEFRFAGRDAETMVFRRQEIAAATEEILTDNGIRKQFSDDIAAVWNGKK